MSWNDPQLLWLLVLSPLAAMVCWRAASRFKLRMQRLLGLGQNSKGGAVLKSARTRTIIKASLLTLAVVLLALAAAGPRWDWRWIESRQRGLDIMVAIDVSRSMEAKDIDPTRMERAKRLVLDLLDESEGDRIGLVAFAGVAFVQCPLTNDHNAIRMFLDVIGTNLIPVQGTDFAQALTTSVKSLTAGGDGQGKLLVILSDGEDHGASIDAHLEEAKAAGIRIISVGMGTLEGGPISGADGSLKTDSRGGVVITRLQEETLKSMATKTGGIYVKVSDPGARMDALYHEGMRSRGTEHETRSSRERVWFERFQWFAGAALILLVLETLIRDVRILLIGVLLPWFLFTPKASAAANPKELFEQGVALEAKGETDQAIAAFDGAVQGSTERALKQRSLYNLGVLKAKKGDLAGASKAFEESLALNPQDQQTRDNLKWAQKAQKQKDEQDQSKKKDDNKKEGDKDQKEDQKPDDSKKDDASPPDDKKPKDDQSKDQKPGESKDQEKPEGGKDPQEKKPKDTEKEGSEGTASEPKDAKEMSKEDAEKLLRMVPDDMGKFYRAPDSPMKNKNSEQDW